MYQSINLLYIDNKIKAEINIYIKTKSAPKVNKK